MLNAQGAEPKTISMTAINMHPRTHLLNISSPLPLLYEPQHDWAAFLKYQLTGEHLCTWTLPAPGSKGAPPAASTHKTKVVQAPTTVIISPHSQMLLASNFAPACPRHHFLQIELWR